MKNPVTAHASTAHVIMYTTRGTEREQRSVIIAFNHNTRHHAASRRGATTLLVTVTDFRQFNQRDRLERFLTYDIIGDCRKPLCDSLAAVTVHVLNVF